MENRIDVKTISIAVILSLIASSVVIVVGYVNLDNPNGFYYCESKGIVMNCDKT
jgi:hypothetical protein